MSTEINVQVLDVGQGSGNLIEVYNGTATPTHLVLIDLGSEFATVKTAGRAAAQYVVDKLKLMKPPTLDALILSHSDNDHINLLAVLLENFDPPSAKNPTKPVLTIKKIFYGGSRPKYTKNKTDYLTLAEKYLPPGVKNGTVTWSNDESGWVSKPGGWKYFHQSDDVYFYLVIGNVGYAGVDRSAVSRTPTRPNGYSINSKSLVVNVYYARNDNLITGDATGLTILKCNKVLEDAGALACFMVTMPHHSSERTTFNFTTSVRKDQTLAEKSLEKFVGYVNAQTISASADQNEGFKHPSMRVMSYFWPKLSSTVWFKDDALKGTNNHFCNAYLLEHKYQFNKSATSSEKWPPADGWYSVQTQRNIFTTRYFTANQQKGVLFPPDPAEAATEFTAKKNIQSPPLGAQWSFTVERNGTKTIRTRSNRAVLAESVRAGFAPLVWPEVASLNLPRSEPPEQLPVAPAREAARIPLSHRAASGVRPRTAASRLRGLRVIR
ncbi:MAG TPA: MBL fold metallo-hydrolase [Pyrinomonadaceae bacterium]